jgi:hypothetical protein
VLLPEKPIDAKKTTSKSEGEGDSMKAQWFHEYSYRITHKDDGKNRTAWIGWYDGLEQQYWLFDNRHRWGLLEWKNYQIDHKPDYSHTSLGAGPDEVTG